MMFINELIEMNDAFNEGVGRSINDIYDVIDFERNDDSYLDTIKLTCDGRAMKLSSLLMSSVEAY